MATVMASTQAPLNMIARRIFCGGFASVDARRASCTNIKIMHNRFAKNHNKAELPSEFLVSSTPSSIATGKRDIEHTPMTTKMTKSAAVLCGLTAQIRENHAIATTGHMVRVVIPR